ncbi:H-NS histone family protein [Burkholderia stagnalis]|uniref:H-NS histone family protein n=1 Tax=Burkholderia stagnalis TaxID=1503054 RepID=UPI0007588F44|nr:H-NS histone family protein [Burkholderia stagnalis]KVL87851.1 H-NS histone [Burkholderia stagnalis]KVM07397.1 H-NS histone [Burkholderia stagnalis]RQQ56010.1 H-NS histone family protein [Burkholderia stagnalis]RQY05249.1 H-NS histone family protein [Burkholderia stagnalis]RQY22747.1 H-NS histone family protein [Burkholderia stagnalis]
MNTYRELLNQLEKLKMEIEVAREQEARLIAERVVELLAESGVIRGSLAQQGRSRRVRVSVKPKYWDPKTGATWSGRGRTPHWLVGKDPEQFRIDHVDDALRRNDESQ